MKKIKEIDLMALGDLSCRKFSSFFSDNPTLDLIRSNHKETRDDIIIIALKINIIIRAFNNIIENTNKIATDKILDSINIDI